MLQMENDYLKGTFYSEIWLFRCIYILFCDILYANICTLNKWTSLGEIKTYYQFYHYGWIIGESFGRNSCLFVYGSSWITNLIIKKITSLIPSPSYFLPPQVPNEPSRSVPN